MIASLARFLSPHGATGEPLAVTGALALAALALRPRHPWLLSWPAVVRDRRLGLAAWGPLGRWMLVGVVLLAGLGAATAASADTALAATLTVCPSGCQYTVIQDAVNAAAPGDTVQVGAGTYTQTVTISKSLTLAGAGAGQTIIDGNNYAQHAPLVAITGTTGQVTVTVSGLTLQHGFGGGLLNNGQPGLEAARVVSSAIVANVNFAGPGFTGYGGGIDNEGGALTVISSTVAGNTAASNGGGLENRGAAHLALVASTVSGNSAGGGAGGGIADGASSTAGMVALTDSTVYSNTAGLGGGLSILDSAEGTLALTDSTVYSNTASVGGGLYDTSISGTVALTGTILAGNRAGQGADCNTRAGVSSLTSGGYNLLGNGDSCQGLTNGARGDQVGTPGNPIDPRLGPLQDNGGPTPTLAPRADSTAIGAVPANICATTIDQRGVARPDLASGSPGYCTVGAVEYQANPATRHVAPTGRDSGDCTASPCQTIGYAVGQAGVFDTVAVAAGTYTEAVTITKPLAVDGAGAGQTIIDGGSALLTGMGAPLVTITGTAGQVTLSGFTIQHGLGGVRNEGRPGVETTHLIDSAIVGNGGNNGGGINNIAGSVTVLRSTIADNFAATYGGGIDNTGDTVEVVSSTISGNAASSDGLGGGIANTGPATSTVRVVASTIYSNTATTGGGIYNGNGSAANKGTVTIVDSTVYSNTATGSGFSQGGGAINNAGALAVTASTIYRNTSASGGGIYRSGGTAALTDTILAGNTASSGSGPDCSGTLTSGGYNLLGNNSACTGPTNGQNGDQVGAPASPLDPRLAPLADNGGPTRTLLPLAGSPAIDAVAAASCIPATDQRGFARPDESADAGTCDVGAVESGATAASTATPTTTSTATSTNTANPTSTNTAAPTSTSTATNAASPTSTNTANPTSTSTSTPLPATATNTTAPTSTSTNTSTSISTPVPTNTSTPMPPTATNTALPPTSTSASTNTVAPTPTKTTAPSTATNTPVPPTATNTATATKTPAPPTATRTSITPPTSTATSTATATPSPSPTTACRPFYAAVSAERVARGGTQDILVAAPAGSTIAATIDTGAAYPRQGALFLPTERGGIGVRILQGTRTDGGYRYTFPVGTFFGYGYALLSFGIPRTAPLGAAPVTAAAREPGGCAATATTRFTVVAAHAAQGMPARSTTAWAGRGVAGTLLSAAGMDAPRATLSPAGLTLDQTTLVGERRSGGTAVGGGSAISTHGASLAACRDTVVSSLPLRLTTASLIRVSGTAGYLPASPRVCHVTLYVALRDASRPTVLATMRVTVEAKLDRVALLGGSAMLRGSGRQASRNYVAAPGRYLLQLHLAPRTRGVRGTLTLRVAALAYMQDRAAAPGAGRSR